MVKLAALVVLALALGHGLCFAVDGIGTNVGASIAAAE